MAQASTENGHVVHVTGAGDTGQANDPRISEVSEVDCQQMQRRGMRTMNM